MSETYINGGERDNNTVSFDTIKKYVGKPYTDHPVYQLEKLWESV